MAGANSVDRDEFCFSTRILHDLNGLVSARQLLP